MFTYFLLLVMCRKLNDTYLESLGVEMLDGYADPHHNRSVMLTLFLYCG